MQGGPGLPLHVGELLGIYCGRLRIGLLLCVLPCMWGVAVMAVAGKLNMLSLVGLWSVPCRNGRTSRRVCEPNCQPARVDERARCDSTNRVKGPMSAGNANMRFYRCC